jgi:hypothetical protein
MNNQESEIGFTVKSESEIQQERESAEEIKLKINNFVWTYAGENTALKEAEEIDCRFFNDIWESRTGARLD